MRRWLPLLTVCLGTFMLLIDVTIVNVALPDMQRDLHASFGSLQWVVDGYALAMAALMLGAGSIADLTGHRRTYAAGLALFAASSLVCGIAPNPAVLIAARVAQGVGAAAMSCTCFALLNKSYDGRDRAAAYGMWGAVAGASSAVGPIVGGLLTEIASWRWIFFVNLPVSVVATALCAWVLTVDEPPHRGRVDVAGMTAFTASAAAATYALIRANEHGWSNPGTWWMLTAAVAALAGFLVVERRSRHAMFDLALLRNRAFTGVLIAGATLFFAAFGALMYTQIWMQSVLGLSPIEAGLVGLPLSVMAFAVSGGIGRYLHGPNPGRIIGGGLLLVAVGGVLGTVLVHDDAGWAALVPGFLAIGAGVGLATATLGSAATSAVGWERAGMATGALNTAQQLGFTVAIATLGGAFTARAGAVLTDRGVPDSQAVARAVAGGQAPALLAQLPPALHDAVRTGAAAGVQGTLTVGGLVGLFGAAAAFGLMRARRRSSAEPEQIRERAQA
ncbi:MFS transporter [Nocardia mexicana]|uniref:EmrB/QacA subfamily drug resistance transporter n=1 Tax=Nocardia mexicana TaxID=279262 RepID=A0A370HC32_9NOCA|nr:MFS transporter [Nocardia mexicana]RDI54051.1 EmrB/QacA subfamily drug resistance transporter [Nocardia mexicana]